MFHKKLNYTIINLAALMLLLYIGVSNINVWWGILVKCVSVLSPFIVGFVFAYAFTPLVKWLQRKGMNKAFFFLFVVIGLLLLVVGIISITLPMLYDQLSLFIKMILQVFDKFSLRFDVNVGTFEIKLTDFLNDTLKDIGAITSSTTIGFMNKSFSFISKLIVGFVGFIYFLVDMDVIRKSVKSFFKKKKKYLEYIRLMDQEITNYLKGLGIFMIIQLIEYSFLFFIIGHPNWLILGVLACLTTIIPYFGGLITNIIAIIMASVVSLPLVIMTSIICLIFPQVDGYLISPKVYGKTNNVNPLITIMAVSIGGTLAGVVGIIAALPCYLFLRTTYLYFQKDLRRGMTKMKETME